MYSGVPQTHLRTCLQRSTKHTRATQASFVVGTVFVLDLGLNRSRCNPCDVIYGEAVFPLCRVPSVVLMEESVFQRQASCFLPCQTPRSLYAQVDGQRALRHLPLRWDPFGSVLTCALREPLLQNTARLEGELRGRDFEARALALPCHPYSSCEDGSGELSRTA